MLEIEVIFLFKIALKLLKKITICIYEKSLSFFVFKNFLIILIFSNGFFFLITFKYILGGKKEMQKCNVAVVEGLKVYFSKKGNKNKKYGPTLLLGCLAKSFLISVC
jgi:hypothetical protein